MAEEKKEHTSIEVASIEDLKRIHGNIKRDLYSEVNSLIPYNIFDSDPRQQRKYLLELAVGHANDLHKWYDTGFTDIIGIDKDDDSIEQAEQRYINKKKRILDEHNIFEVNFEKGDLKDENFIENIKNKYENTFDVVSINFALHYFFENTDDYKILKNLITMIHAVLKPGGIFMGIDVDGTRIIHLDERNIKGELFEINPLWKRPGSVKNDYNYKLKGDTSGYFNRDRWSYEFLVDMNILSDIARENNRFKIAKIQNISDVETEMLFLDVIFSFVKI